MKKSSRKGAAKKTSQPKSAPKKQPAKGSKKTAKKNTESVLQDAFPMASAIDDVVAKSVPTEIVNKVKSAPSKKSIISPTYPYEKTIKGDVYEDQIHLLHIELVKMQAWCQQTGERIVAIFEGRDAAGKGGSIKRFTEYLNPRGARVVALAKPSDAEKGQWYFQRYVEHMPTSGEIVLFDRSWYNRAGVEKVMGFCSPKEYLEFMRQCPEFERMLVRSGVRLFKFWFSVSREEQLRRFMGRAKDPLKQWKLSPMDVESLGRWDEYTKAKESMLFYTDTADAPWTIVRSDDKKRARLNSIRYLLSKVPYAGRDVKLLKELNPLIVGSAKDIYESDERSPKPIDPSAAA
ncbi:polyphosphate kinase 2 [Cerasicoccus frondis]|uniref:polyphosphate kinase 2 n=1 Tax=Cerasicoccus frondis TaxID=490090 RepID=UPI002852C545|nr:polyphosphate kinase 2 [Cerasicoccus frondis]